MRVGAHGRATGWRSSRLSGVPGVGGGRDVEAGFAASACGGGSTTARAAAGLGARAATAGGGGGRRLVAWSVGDGAFACAPPVAAGARAVPASPLARVETHT